MDPFTENETNETRRAIDAAAREGAASAAALADAFRKKLEAMLAALPGEEREQAPSAPVTASYRTPEIVRSVEEALQLGRRNARVKERRAEAPAETEETAKELPRRETRSYSFKQKLAQIGRMSDEIAGELPAEFMKTLEGGINLTERTKVHPQSDPRQPLLILGEYRNDPRTGRSIMLYGGSIIRTYGRLPEARLREELERIIRHEFTHHVEGLCGERGLEISDEVRLENYRQELDELGREELSSRAEVRPADAEEGQHRRRRRRRR